MDWLIALATGATIAGEVVVATVATTTVEDGDAVRRAVFIAVLSAGLFLSALGCALLTVRTGGGAAVPAAVLEDVER